MKSFNVIKEQNGVFISYDIMPYFIEQYKKKKKPNRPVTYDDFKDFIIKEGTYMYWSRCEYEILLSDWPNQEMHKKIDIFDQIKMNLDVITEVLIDNINNGKKQRNKGKS